MDRIKHIKLDALPVVQTYAIDWGDGSAIQNVISVINTPTVVQHTYQNVENFPASTFPIIKITTATGGTTTIHVDELTIMYPINSFYDFGYIYFPTEPPSDDAVKLKIDNTYPFFLQHLSQINIDNTEYVAGPYTKFNIHVPMVVDIVTVNISYAGPTPDETIIYYKALEDGKFWSELYGSSTISGCRFEIPFDLTDTVTIDWSVTDNYGNTTVMETGRVYNIVDGEEV